MPLPRRAPRARENRTRYVVLGMLTHGPGTAYAIREAVATSVGHFWQESYGQLYPALRELEAEGLVVRAEEGGRGPGRPGAVYAITPAGREALRAWVSLSPVKDVFRSEFLLKLFFASTVPTEVTLHHLRLVEEAARGGHAQLQALAERWEEVTGGHPDAPFWRLTLDCGLEMSATMMAWARRAADAVRDLAARRQAAPPASAHPARPVPPRKAAPSHPRAPTRAATKGGRR